MPFSSTSSCAAEEWTSVFENVFKPAIEGAGQEYECRRSEANRGNVVARIIRDLNDAYVVLADLTDRNANVFYELGVRHALKNRTIIVAQRREDLPFDLQGYASHVYDWKSAEGKKLFAERMRQLLQEIDTNPDRPDNPVSDFLQETPPPRLIPSAPEKTNEDTRIARPLVGPGSERLDITALTRTLAKNGPPHAAKATYRLTRPTLLAQLSSMVGELNQRNVPAVQIDQIQTIAQDFISPGELATLPIEQFALVSVEEQWKEGGIESINFAGDMIGVSESPKPGRSIRLAVGVPALLAWRLLILMGAKALAEDAHELVDIIVRHPIEVEAQGRFSHRSLIDRRNLFYAEAFLGYADQTIIYLRDLWDRQTHLREFFQLKDDFHFQLAQFLMIVALTSAGRGDEGHILYPGYKLMPQADRAMAALCGRLANKPAYRDSIAKIIIDGTGTTLKDKWPSLVSQLNDAELGDKYFLNIFGPRFPATLEG